MNFQRESAGRYISSCRTYRIAKKGKWWTVSWAHSPNMTLLAEPTLYAAKIQALRLAGKIIPAKVRPVANVQSRFYMTNCRLFMFSKCKGNCWQVKPAIAIGSPLSVSMLENYLLCHGLDSPVHTLREAVRRLEVAVEVDPPHLLLEKAS